MSELRVPEELISAEAIKARVAELGSMISQDYQGLSLVAVGVLNGAFIFTADLVRHIHGVPIEIGFITVASYADETESCGPVRIVHDLDTCIKGKHVMIVEDIVDTGKTLTFLHALLARRHPASLATCALLDKPERREVWPDVRYRGFTIPNRFVVGYGLDHKGQYRNLDYIGVLPE